MKIVLRILLAVIVIALGGFLWWYYIDTRAPESRAAVISGSAEEMNKLYQDETVQEVNCEWGYI